MFYSSGSLYLILPASDPCKKSRLLAPRLRLPITASTYCYTLCLFSIVMLFDYPLFVCSLITLYLYTIWFSTNIRLFDNLLLLYALCPFSISIIFDNPIWLFSIVIIFDNTIVNCRSTYDNNQWHYVVWLGHV